MFGGCSPLSAGELPLIAAEVSSEKISHTVTIHQQEIVTTTDPVGLKKPSRPIASDVTSDSLKLSWTAPDAFQEGDYFQIGYKETAAGSKWIFFTGEFIESTQILTNIKSDTKFVFRVRVVFNDGEGPYSEESEEVKTPRSPASDFVDFAVRLEDSKTSPYRYALPLCEIKEARNITAKTRKFEIGSPNENSVGEKTLLMIGETGTGKSTMVDGIANYIHGVKWDDPFRFNIINLEEEEKPRTKNQDLSQTEWITCYTVYPKEGSRIPYTLNIIDTPGFGDTRGLERDQEIVEQIRQMFSLPKPKGVVYIDAVCFLIKAPDARLTLIQSYIFQFIMSMFGKDIEKNICSLITFADGKDPPVWAALMESRLPFGQRFTFNNSALFTRNTDLSQMSLSPMFWELGLLSFRNFFRHLDTLSTKSLQLTSDVLNERNRIESTLRKIEKNLEIGLLKLKTLTTEKKIFEDNNSAIIENADFTYEVETIQHIKQDLPRGVRSMNCNNCNFTCHENCGSDNDDEQINCRAMNKGYCMICPDQCIWRKHTKSKYTFIYKQVKQTVTYAEKKRKYEEAMGKKLTLENNLTKMGEELDQMVDVIEDMMTIVNNCNERLNEIALRPNPLSMVQHIDMMVQNEEMQRKTGYMGRIDVLQRFRKRAEICNDVDMFHKEAFALGVKGKRQKDTRFSLQRIKDFVLKFDN